MKSIRRAGAIFSARQRRLYSAEQRINLQIPEERTDYSRSLDLSGLDLDAKDLEKLMPKITKIPNLTYLNLSGNQLTSIPKNIGDLANLKSLWLTGNKLKTLPDSLWNIGAMEDLRLGDNALESLSPNIAKLSRLQVLRLYNNDLEGLPRGFWTSFSALEVLDLGKNQLGYIPEDLGNLSNLIYLNVSHNGLKVLPNNLGALTNLQRLHANDNQLTDLPGGLWNLSQLTHLLLEHNQLSHIEEELGDFEMLKYLNLKANQLETLPESLVTLGKLYHLDLGDNHLERIPENIGDLRSLSRLDLSGNALTSLPDSLGNLWGMRNLDLRNNTLEVGQVRLLQQKFVARLRSDFNIPNVEVLLEKVYGREYPQALEKFNALDRKPVRIQNLRIDVKATLEKFLTNIPLEDPYHPHEVYTTTARLLLDPILDPETDKSQRDKALYEVVLPTSKPLCRGHIEKLLTNTYINQNTKPGEQISGLLYDMLSVRAMEEAIFEKFGFERGINNYNPTVTALLHGLFQEVPRPSLAKEIPILGGRMPIPVPSLQIQQEWNTLRFKTDITESFAQMCCHTDSRTGVPLRQNGSYLYDARKTREIATSYIERLGLRPPPERTVQAFPNRTIQHRGVPVPGMQTPSVVSGWPQGAQHRGWQGLLIPSAHRQHPAPRGTGKAEEKIPDGQRHSRSTRTSLGPR